MTTDLKTDFDPAAGALYRGARENNAGLCAKFFGKADIGRIVVNAKALRIAAENKSYRAFERMLDMAAAHPMSDYEIDCGTDWRKVEEIAKDDPRLAAAVRRYDQRTGAFFDGMEQGASLSPPPPATGFFSHLKFW